MTSTEQHISMGLACLALVLIAIAAVLDNGWCMLVGVLIGLLASWCDSLS